MKNVHRNGVIQHMGTWAIQIICFKFKNYSEIEKFNVKEQNCLVFFHSLGNVSEEKGGICHSPPWFEYQQKEKGAICHLPPWFEYQQKEKGGICCLQMEKEGICRKTAPIIKWKGGICKKANQTKKTC